MGHSIYSNTMLGRYLPKRSWHCLLRTPLPPPHCSPVVFVLVYASPILFQSQFHKGRWQSAMWGICPPQSVHTFGPEQAVWGTGQPRASTMSSPALPLTDFLEVGVLPQQLSNHICYAAYNLPTSLNMPCLRHVARLPWQCRARVPHHAARFPFSG